MGQERQKIYLYFVSIIILTSIVGCNTQSPYIPPPSSQPVMPVAPLPTQPKTVAPLTVVKPVESKQQGFYHTVQKGETLWRIAKKYKVTIDTIERSNRLPDVTHLEIGQMLFIPGKREPGKHESISKEVALLPLENTFIWPLKGRILSHFGSVIDGARNKGIDIRATANAPVRAAKSGVVSYEGTRIKGYGKMIILDHRDDYQTVYAFNNENLVHVGMKVRQGDIIVYAGSTGRTNISSRHFEIRKKSIPHNPLVYLE